MEKLKEGMFVTYKNDENVQVYKIIDENTFTAFYPSEDGSLIEIKINDPNLIIQNDLLKAMRKIIYEILEKNQDDCKIGSDGEYYTEKCVFAYDFDSVTEQINNEIEKMFKSFMPNLECKDEFEKAVEPAIRYLFKNHNPHTKIHIDYSSAELLSGERCYNLNNEIPD